jgi:hypothetical protein
MRALSLWHLWRRCPRECSRPPSLAATCLRNSAIKERHFATWAKGKIPALAMLRSQANCNSGARLESREAVYRSSEQEGEELRQRSRIGSTQLELVCDASFSLMITRRKAATVIFITVSRLPPPTSTQQSEPKSQTLWSISSRTLDAAPPSLTNPTGGTAPMLQAANGGVSTR